MIRNVDIREISDGRLYGPEEMVRADTAGCKGCSACCSGMGDTLVLDPYDVWQFQVKGGMPFETLLEGRAALRVVDGLILPHLVMNGPDERCAFLDMDGRCSVHALRPGFCRLFPLGRIYDDKGFKYFLQTGECEKAKGKVRVRKWIGIEPFTSYEKYIKDWHSFWSEARSAADSSADPGERKRISMLVLRMFFLAPWDEKEEFYTQFYVRLAQAAGELA